MLAGEGRQSAEHRPSLDRIEAVGRFVEDHEPRIVDDRRGEGDLLTHPHREGLDRPVAFLAGIAPIEHLVRPAERLDAGDPRQAGGVADHLHPRQPRHGAFVLRDDADEPAHGMGLPPRIDSEDAHAPLGEAHEAENRLHQRALAGAIGADQSGDAPGDGERHTVEHGARPVALDDPRGQHRLFHGWRSDHVWLVPGPCRLDPVPDGLPAGDQPSITSASLTRARSATLAS